jgi:hypothetical protein
MAEGSAWGLDGGGQGGGDCRLLRAWLWKALGVLLAFSLLRFSACDREGAAWG